MTQWQEYLKLLSGLSRTLEQLTKVEQDKKTAASQGDLAGVEDCMKQEQVLSLSLRGYDQRRDKMLASLGLQGVPLNQLEDHSPPDLMLETRRTVEELRRQYTLFQAASQRPETRWRSTCGRSSASWPSRPATPVWQRKNARDIRPISGLEVRAI